MRTSLALALVAASALAHAGCTAFGCGAFEGGGNRVYAREDEMLLLCENGGFVATLTTTMLEGRTAYSETGLEIGTRGEDGTLAFELVVGEDGSVVTPQLGDAPWTRADFNATALDHSNILCTDLEQRSWWTAP